jgi:hypothetical protein
MPNNRKRFYRQGLQARQMLSAGPVFLVKSFFEAHEKKI